MRRKYKNISSVIAGLQASIIGLSEIENKNALKTLQSYADLKIKFPYSVFSKSKNAPNGIALLSAFPIQSSRNHQVTFTDNFKSRPILEVTVLVNRRPLTIFVTHWPSKQHKEKRRKVVAATLQNIMDTLPTEQTYLIMGDLNSNFNEYDYAPQNKPAINTILQTGRCTPFRFLPHAPHEIYGTQLYSPWSEKQHLGFSYIYKGEKETIDHFLLSPNLFNNKGISYVKNSFKVETLNGTLLRKGSPYRWQLIRTRSGNTHIGSGYSDHLPISITLTDSLPQEYRREKNRSPFAYSTEGWRISSPYFKVERLRLSPKCDKRILHFSGKPNKNATVFTKNVTPPPGCQSLIIEFCGSAHYYIRYKKDNSPWLYLRKNGMTKNAGKYEKMQSRCWKRVTIPCQNKKSVTLQMKSYAHNSVDIYVRSINAIY